jgi:hypothetical protein
LKRGGEVSEKGQGGVETKGDDGAVMVYGNYDREYSDVKVRLIGEIS